MHSYLAPQILWDSEAEKLYIGMQNQEIAHSWIEYLSCAQLLPIPVKIKTAQAIDKSRIRQEIIASCSYEQAINFVVELQVKGLDLNATPPQIDRDINQFTRGDIVQILYNDTIGDRRIGKQATVTQVEPKINQLWVDVEQHGSTCTKAKWVVKTGHEDLPPVVRWEKIEETGWTAYYLYANHIKTTIRLAKSRWKSEEQKLGIPNDKPYVLFSDQEMLDFFSDVEIGKTEAIKNL